jgi:UDP-glucuronate decarboxylase
VYGDPLVHPQPESYFGNVNTYGPRACYDEGKRCAETFIYNYQLQYGLDLKIARLFNTYGPRMAIDDGRVIPAFIQSFLTNKDLLIEGDGLQTRSFCYVDDTIKGLISLMSTSGVRSPINIGNDKELSILELAEIIKRYIPSSESAFSFVDKAKDDPKKRRPCLKLANELLDWRPEVTLEEGLVNTIKYFIDAK